MNTKVIAIVAVAVLVVAAGGGAAVFLLNKSDDDKSHSLDGMYMNIGTSDVVTIYNKSTAAPSTASTGSISKAVGAELSSDVVGSLYKKNDKGEFEPVKFFKNKESVSTGDGEEVEWLAEYSLVLMEKCGKFLHLQYLGEGTSSVELFVDTETGKIYQVATESTTYFGKRAGDVVNGRYPVYTYCGMFKGVPLFYKAQNGNFESLCTLSTDADALKISEVLNTEQYEVVFNDVRIYKNNVIEFTTGTDKTSAQIDKTYLMFGDGQTVNVEKLKLSERQECDGYLCNSVTEDANGFVESYTRYTTSKDATETVNPTDAEKYRIASEKIYDKQIFKYTEGNSTVILRIVGPCDLEKITIGSDLSKTVTEWDISKEIKVSGHENKSEPFSENDLFTVYENVLYYKMVGGEIWTKINVSFNGNYMFVTGTDTIVAYDMTSASTMNAGIDIFEDAPIANVKDMYYKDGHVIVTGVLEEGSKTFYATLEDNGEKILLASDVILKETIILPLN
ncbi:MAG: hypothetical protein J6T68_01410 [Candidatus Methanomethylophilaceae archaeon]|nr:hypothetical protein [Candidatus Methanomethylophilaceae archaeon]